MNLYSAIVLVLTCYIAACACFQDALRGGLSVKRQKYIVESSNGTSSALSTAMVCPMTQSAAESAGSGIASVGDSQCRSKPGLPELREFGDVYRMLLRTNAGSLLPIDYP